LRHIGLTGPTEVCICEQRNPPGSCSAAEWQAASIYTGGNVVAHKGHRWTAKWWTHNEEPGVTTSGVWTDNGAC
jgi:chitinase